MRSRRQIAPRPSRGIAPRSKISRPGSAAVQIPIIECGPADSRVYIALAALMASLDHLRNASTDVVADLGQPNKVGQASSGFEKYLFQAFACVLVGLDGKCEPGSANAHCASRDAGVGRMGVDGEWRQPAIKSHSTAKPIGPVQTGC